MAALITDPMKRALGPSDSGNRSTVASTPSNAPPGRRLDDQVWVHGTVWHKQRVRPRVPIDMLLDTGAGGGSYMGRR